MYGFASPEGNWGKAKLVSEKEMQLDVRERVLEGDVQSKRWVGNIPR